MDQIVVCPPDAGPSVFPAEGVRRFLLLGAIFVGALALRLYCIADMPQSFHPTRQYRAALIAHAIYAKHDLAAAKTPLLEPPLTEGIAAVLYTFLGRESLTAARTMSIVWWMLAALFLFLLAERAISRDGAVVAVLYFLFLPFGVLASRSFQPDPLMIALFVGATWCIYRLRETPSRGWLAAAVVLSAMAIFVKPVCMFSIWLAFLASGVFQNGIRATAKNAWTWLYFALSFLPTLAYYGYGLFIADFLRWQAGASFVPSLILQASFWREWLQLAVYVIGAVPLIVAVFGPFLARSRLTKGLLAGLWGGYVVMGLIFTFHIHTHDYYQEPLIPIVALSLATVLARAFERLPRLNLVAKVAVAIAVAAAVVIPSVQTWRCLRADENGGDWAAMCTRIGDRVAHSGKTIYLSRDYGQSLMYFGDVDGTRWPYTYDMPFSPEKTREALDRMIADLSPDYFIVAEMEQFRQQRHLQEALTRFPLVFSTENCRVYNLRPKPK